MSDTFDPEISYGRLDELAAPEPSQPPTSQACDSFVGWQDFNNATCKTCGYPKYAHEAASQPPVICQWCDAAKENPLGMCPKCFRFPQAPLQPPASAELLESVIWLTNRGYKCRVPDGHLTFGQEIYMEEVAGLLIEYTEAAVASRTAELIQQLKHSRDSFAKEFTKACEYAERMLKAESELASLRQELEALYAIAWKQAGKSDRQRFVAMQELLRKHKRAALATSSTQTQPSDQSENSAKGE